MSYGNQGDPKKRASGRPTPPPGLKPQSPPAPPALPRKRTLPAGASPTRPVAAPPKQQAEIPAADRDEYAIRPTDEYAVREEPAPAPPMPVHLSRPREPVDTQDPLPEPPTLCFFSGIFSFPFYLRSLGVWMLTGFGLTAFALGIMVCNWTLAVGLTMAFWSFIMPVIWIGYLAVSFTSAMWLKIVQVTAAGYDIVDDWRAGDWREWPWAMVYPVGMLVPSLLIGWGVYATSEMARLPFGLAAGFFVYPILLLSAMETGSPLNPVSMPVLRSLGMVWWAWLIVYIETAVMVAALGVFVYYAFQEHPWVTIMLAVPMLAAGLMIYARLLGRLAWYIGQKAELKRAQDEEE
jgi:hypothetical protein